MLLIYLVVIADTEEDLIKRLNECRTSEAKADGCKMAMEYFNTVHYLSELDTQEV